MTPLNKLVSILAPIMGKEVDDPEVLKAAVDVVMAIREPSLTMHNAAALGQPQAQSPSFYVDSTGAIKVDWKGADPTGMWKDMIDALLTEGG